jgi:hypothetical protein
LWRVRPRIAVCGHIHDGRGAETIRWNLGGSEAAEFAEEESARWEDPGAGDGSKKMSLIDLTSRQGGKGLDNDGSSSQGFESDERLREDGVVSGRRETCVVNAAIMKSKYPHVGGKKYNKPIVVDIDLPTIK